MSRAERPSPVWEIGNSDIMGQTNDLKIDSYHFLARRSAFLGEGEDWLAQCQDNVECQVMVLVVWSPSVAAL